MHRAYFWIAVVIVAALVLDWLSYDSAGLIVVGRKIWQLAEWMAFWR